MSSASSNQTSGQANSNNQNKTNNSLENFKVAVRLRPFTERERQRQSKRIVEIEQNTVALYNPKWPDEPVKRFTFDHSYWSHDGFKRNQDGVNEPDQAHPNSAKYVGQEQVFQDLGRFLLENALEGYNSALLAYGQTGSGKSYTVSGYGQNEGILPRFARELFAELDKRQLDQTKSTSSEAQQDNQHKLQPEILTETSQKGSTNGPRYEVYFSMIEIYNEVVRDLLAKQNGSNSQKASSIVRRGLRVREHPKRGFFVESLTSFQCSSKEEIENLIEEGQLNKSIAATSMNETSSRGHTIYEFQIRQFRPKEVASGPIGETATTSSPSPAPPSSTPTRGMGTRAVNKKSQPVETMTSSMVQLVDLAGSERMTVHVTGGGELGGSVMDLPIVRSASRSGSPYSGSHLEQNGSGSSSTATLQMGQSQARNSSRNVRSSTTAARRIPSQAPTSASSSSSTTTNSQSTTNSMRRQVQTTSSQQAVQTGASSRQQPSSGLLLGPNSGNQHNQRFKESVSINQSLSALGNCIQVLSQFSQQQTTESFTASIKQPKIPYRDSVLTKLLNRCCLSGNSKVVLIATLSPADANYDDTLSTMRFADRAKQIRTHAVINRTIEGVSGEGVTALQRENERLKQILDGRVTRSDDSSQTSNFDDSENMQDNFNGPKSSDNSPKQQARQSKAERASTVTKTRASGAKTNDGKTSGKQPTDGTKKQPKNNLRIAQENLLSSKMQRDEGAFTSRALPVGQAKGSRERGQKIAAPSGGKLVSSTSSPTLAANGQDQMEQLVSSAKKKMRQKGRRFVTSDSVEDEEDGDLDDEYDVEPMRKSQSVGQNLTETISNQNSAFQFGSELLDEIDLNELAEIIDDENLLSPDSDDSFNNGHGSRAKFDENMSKQEKANILNRLLSNSSVANKIIRKQIESSINQSGAVKNATKLDRPKKAGAKQHLRPVKRGELANSAQNMKKSNPYLSNLNPDEQLTSMITYIVEPGETIVGKEDSCDLLIYGPGLRGRHAKLTRVLQKNIDQAKVPPTSGQVFIEPIFPQTDQNNTATEQTKVVATGSKSSQAKRVALLVNGEPVLSRLLLAHGDRLLFGSTNYFVFVDESAPKSQKAPPLESITYDMAHAEVMRKMMSDTENDAMIREIKDYTHRPGTGKKRNARDTDEGATSSTTSPEISSDHSKPVGGVNSKSHDGATGSKMVDQDNRGQLLDNIKEEESELGSGGQSRISGGGNGDPDELYRDKLMADTYEFAMPIAEANAVANEMGIKVTYGLKILTGEEQLEPLLSAEEAQTLYSVESDGNVQGDKETNSKLSNVVVTSQEPIKPYTLDIPPELYVHVRLEELQLDFYWTRDKFQERRVNMLELYGAWDVGGKSGLVEYLIEQSKYQGYYMADPFVDDIRASWVLVGHAQVSLGPVGHMASLRESFDVLDLDDEIVASLLIEAMPCQVEPVDENDPDHLEWPYKIINESDKSSGAFLENPRELLGKSFVFMLRVVSCSRVPPRFAQVFCQYTLNRDQPTIRTQLVANNQHNDDREELELEHAEQQSGQNDEKLPIHFDHKHFVVIERVTEEILDFLQQGFLTIQLVGQYERIVPSTANNQLSGSAASRQSKQQTSSSATSSSSRSLAQPTLVSTIISSINKYRFRMEQQSAALQNFGSQFQNSDYANSVSYSANSANYQLASSSMMNSNSGPSSVTSASATSNLFDQQQDDDEGINGLNGANQENIIDMILTKRKLDRAENQLHYIKRTINIAEHHNKKHIPVRTVKKLLNSYGQELEGGSLEEMAAEVTAETKSSESKHSNCIIQ